MDIGDEQRMSEEQDFDESWALPAQGRATGGPIDPGQLLDIKGESGTEHVWPGTASYTPPIGYVPLQGFSRQVPPPWGLPNPTLANPAFPGMGVQIPGIAQEYPRPMTTAEIRAMVNQIVDEKLRPETVNPHRYKRVEITDGESGQRWRGMLYAVEPEPVCVPASGVCWACGERGEAMEWHAREGRSHLIHATGECRQRAEEKQETREHRG